MALFMIGLGLADEKDISLRGLEALKKCEFIYFENYTSKLQCNAIDLEKLTGKEHNIADREFVEKGSDEMIEKAKGKNVAFMVIGDPMCATTHIDLYLRAKDRGVKVEMIHNASIISAIGEIGLEVYKYGKITSIPFHNKDVRAPVEVYEMNSKNGLHTLFLLDLDPKSKKFMSINEGAEYLIRNGISKDAAAVGCACIGSSDRVIRAAALGELGRHDLGSPPYCIVMPGKMHFIEEEALKLWKE
ncbi:diphthine synthase [Candidatus Woesearchaeota archaeon]|nr:diphthine synthase [Candidatus Woesearchaeota archaeon]